MTKQPDWFELIYRCGKKFESKAEKRGDSWTTCTRKELLMRVKAECDELEFAVRYEGSNEIQAECIDVINQAAMLYSRMGRLTEDKK